MKLVNSLTFMAIGGLLFTTPSPALQTFGFFGMLLGVVMTIGHTFSIISDFIGKL